MKFFASSLRFLPAILIVISVLFLGFFARTISLQKKHDESVQNQESSAMPSLQACLDDVTVKYKSLLADLDKIKAQERIVDFDSMSGKVVAAEDTSSSFRESLVKDLKTDLDKDYQQKISECKEKFSQ